MAYTASGRAFSQDFSRASENLTLELSPGSGIEEYTEVMNFASKHDRRAKYIKKREKWQLATHCDLRPLVPQSFCALITIPMMHRVTKFNEIAQDMAVARLLTVQPIFPADM